MNPLTYYLVKMLLCSGIFYSYYCVALRNNRFHQWNRYYILVTTVLSLFIPLLQIPLPFSNEATTSPVLMYTSSIITLREQILPVHNPVDFSLLFTIWYGLIAGLLLVRICYSCLKIYRMIKHNPVQSFAPYLFIKSNAVTAPCSFFSYIFWDANTSLESPEGRQILQHEMVHIEEKHSVDKMILELITALCWINPFFYLYKQELAIIHEFIADKKTAARNNVAQYAQTILQMALQSNQLAITNSFFHPPIKRRILMLTQFTPPKFSYLRRLMVLPLGASLFCSLAFVTDNHSISSSPMATATISDTTTPQNPDKNKGENVKFAPPANQKNANKSKEDNVKFPPPANHSEVFTLVEHPPQFPGGEPALRKYLSTHIKYPRKAQENNVKGTVYVQFIVGADGKIRDAKTVGQPLGSGLEEESLRVVRAMPKWIAGVQNKRKVAVQFNLPINYTIQE
jgi:TonB family protein